MSTEREIDPNPKVAFGKVYEKAKRMGLSGKDMVRLESLEFLRTEKSSNSGFLTAMLLCFLAVIVGIYFRDWPMSRRDVVSVFALLQDFDINNDPCLLHNDADFLNDVFRPLQDCAICTDLQTIDRVEKITAEEFEAKYAYTKRPVVITDGAGNWSATKVFSFNYFKSLYGDGSPALESVASNCQFFPYKTNFSRLGEVFQMSEERAQMKDGAEPWYIGW